MAHVVRIQPGARYNRWKVVEQRKDGWLCRCDCGTERVLTNHQVRRLKSCGCKNIVKQHAKVAAAVKIGPGSRFNRWTVLRRAPYRHRAGIAWICRCDCGTEREIGQPELLRGTSQSCGCRRREMGYRMGIPPSKDLPGLPEGSYDKHEDMETCSNCSASFDTSKEGLVLTAQSRTVANICGGCCAGVRTAKIVIKRPEVGGYQYEQWAPIEVMAGGLTSPKKAG